MNIAYRWFLGYPLHENIPHFSTVSRNFKHRYSLEVIDSVFEWVLFEIEESGYFSAEAVFIDGTHIKANANMKKAIKKPFPKLLKSMRKDLPRKSVWIERHMVKSTSVPPSQVYFSIAVASTGTI